MWLIASLMAIAAATESIKAIAAASKKNGTNRHGRFLPLSQVGEIIFPGLISSTATAESAAILSTHPG